MRRIVPCFLAFGLIATGLLAAPNAARSQDDNGHLFDRRVARPRLVFTESDVYEVGQPTRLYDGNTRVYPDPRGRYAIIGCVDAMPTRAAFLAPTVGSPTGESATRNTSLLLYDSQTGKTTTLWQHALLPGQYGGISHVEWLTGRDVALASAGIESPSSGRYELPRPPDSAYDLLEIHPGASERGLTRTLLHSVFPLVAYPSPRFPNAMLQEDRVEDDAASGQRIVATRYRTLNAAGVVSAPLRLGPHASGGYEWSEGGDAVYLVDQPIIPAVPENEPADAATAATTARPKRQWYAVTVESGRLTPLDKKPKPTPQSEGGKANPAPPIAVRLANEATLVALPERYGADRQAAPPNAVSATVVHARAPVAHNTEKLYPLWLQSLNLSADNGGHFPTGALIAADAGDATLLPDGSAILYVSEGALRVVPLTHRPRADVEGPYRKYLQQQTLSNAKQIGLAILQYSQDYDENFPSVTNFVKAISPYLKDDSLVNNPETGQLGFVYLLNGESMASIDEPASKVMGYLSGPGGRAALYADGHAKWEPDAGGGN